MKNYFQKILSLFVGYDYSKQANQHFYRWLTNGKHEDEKDEALWELYLEAKKRGNTSGLDKSLERWRQSTNNVPAPLPKRFGIRPFLKVWQSAAAVVLLIVSISLGYMLYHVEKTESDLVQQFIPTTQLKTFLLPDGSQVQMNSRSILLYPKKFTDKSRSVFLIGEANFKVKPDKKKPFIVKTDGFQVTALGTEFNVSAYAEEKDVCATLITGSVLVEYDNLTKKRILKPNEQLVYNKESRRDTLDYPNMEDVTAWQRGELVFRQKTIKDIITILERKYDYKFVYSLHSLKNDRYSFRFRDKATLPEVMNVIVDVAGNLTFKIEGDECHIIQK